VLTKAMRLPSGEKATSSFGDRLNCTPELIHGGCAKSGDT
jgi:hypothetical protein